MPFKSYSELVITNAINRHQSVVSHRRSNISHNDNELVHSLTIFRIIIIGTKHNHTIHFQVRFSEIHSSLYH